MFLLEGESIQHINGVKYVVKAGQCVVLNKQTLHAEKSTKEDAVKVLSCVLDYVHLTGLQENCIISSSYSPVIDCKEYLTEIKNIFEELYQDNSKPDPYSYELAQINVMKLIVYLYRCMHRVYDAVHVDRKSLAILIKDYIDKNYNQDITLNHLAETFFVSPYYISHEMKQKLGLSSIQYLINRRIGEAQRYLVFTNKPVKEISNLVGYENVNYFNKLFLKKTGYTAAMFRESKAGHHGTACR